MTPIDQWIKNATFLERLWLYLHEKLTNNQFEYLIASLDFRLQHIPLKYLERVVKPGLIALAKQFEMSVQFTNDKDCIHVVFQEISDDNQ